MAPQISSTPLRAPYPSLGHWLPSNRELVKGWLDDKLKQLKHLKATVPALDLDPTLKELQKLVDNDPVLKTLSVDMFTQIPEKYKDDPTGKPQIHNFDTMLQLVNLIIKSGPEWYFKKEPETAMGLIGFPINAILDWPMGTSAGFEFFLSEQVNICWHNILSTWGSFLASTDSRSVLNPENGWLSKTAQEQLSIKGNAGSGELTFDQLYNCDPNKEYYGFTSWDDFFTRTYKDGVRPVKYKDDAIQMPGEPDPKAVILNGCESGPLQYVENVKLFDNFNLKGQPYSLLNMLNGDPLAQLFVGGSVYQAFLSALSYHCWHAPVNGTILKTEVVPGTYYSENYFEGFADPDKEPDPAAANNSQPYLSAVATRAIVYIQADNPKIGLMAIVYIGMAEVSSCEFTIPPGARIVKGDMIGKFHFGGSTHCMVFRPQTKLEFVVPPQDWPKLEYNNHLNSALAVVL